MNTILWSIQAVLAFTFAYSGMMKSTQQREKLVSIGQTGVADLSYPLIRFIGVAEILGAIGIIMPWGVQLLPFLTPVAAICFACIMVPASVIHYKRKEFKSVALNALLFVCSVFVAFERFRQL
ncbi:DoxX family protein [Chitinophaga sp. MM2321]|uniref:DoxX family protein n=1 Tax=Chitinophaga sp. MM2321 TaxID=3137178 RepID=UPI0032D5787E